MSKEKQIEEMAETFDEMCDLDLLADCEEKDCSKCMATALYNAGYRKQREGEWKEDIIAFCNVCSACKAKVDRYAIKCNSGKLNYCPNCGAKMGGGAE